MYFIRKNNQNQNHVLVYTFCIQLLYKKIYKYFIQKNFCIDKYFIQKSNQTQNHY